MKRWAGWESAGYDARVKNRRVHRSFVSKSGESLDEMAKKAGTILRPTLFEPWWETQVSHVKSWHR
jgi:hypothetical protein